MKKITILTISLLSFLFLSLSGRSASLLPSAQADEQREAKLARAIFRNWLMIDRGKSPQVADEIINNIIGNAPDASRGYLILAKLSEWVSLRKEYAHVSASLAESIEISFVLGPSVEHIYTKFEKQHKLFHADLDKMIKRINQLEQEIIALNSQGEDKPKSQD